MQGSDTEHHGDDDRQVDTHGKPGPPDRRPMSNNVDDDFVALPEQTRDDTPEGWGEAPETNDERLTENRPPHWD